jgi:UDP-N-acetylmuramoyl-tripeptide--D-alanyl-D-alanine ligase
MNPLWTRHEIAQATGGRFTGEVPGVLGISIDTRTLEPGDLFFAIRGDAHDGHDFVPAALSRRAAAAVVSKERASELAGAGPLLVVEDVLRAMEQLGVASRARSSARIVAVTGSVGKTSTKEALRLALMRQGSTHASLASYNNHWGVPLTLSRMPRETRYGIFEIGMNHPGEILPLTAMVRPHVALVTNVEPVHIQYFRSASAIADAKGEIFSGLEPGGTAVLNRDNPHWERLRSHAFASRAGRVVTFGEHEAADIRAERIILKSDTSIVDALIFGRRVTYRLGTPGRHIAINSLGVLEAVDALGADLAIAALALAHASAPVGRGERTRLSLGSGDALLIDESYNANPASVRAALATLGSAETGKRGRRIAVLGDMLELGPDGGALHRALVEPIEAHRVDLVFTAGSLMQELFAALPASRRGDHAPTAAELVTSVVQAVQPGDVVMVKGSNSIRMATIVKALKEASSAGRAVVAAEG